MQRVIGMLSLPMCNNRYSYLEIEELSEEILIMPTPLTTLPTPIIHPTKWE